MVPRIRDVAVAVLGGFVVFLLLWPSSGQDSMPPKCWNTFGSEVSCDQPTLPRVLVVAVALFLLMWLVSVWLARRDRTSA